MESFAGLLFNNSTVYQQERTLLERIYYLFICLKPICNATKVLFYLYEIDVESMEIMFTKLKADRKDKRKIVKNMF